MQKARTKIRRCVLTLFLAVSGSCGRCLFSSCSVSKQPLDIAVSISFAHDQDGRLTLLTCLAGDAFMVSPLCQTGTLRLLVWSGVQLHRQHCSSWTSLQSCCHLAATR